MFGASDRFAGANQYYVGKYLNTEEHSRIFKEMMGRDASQKEQEKLDKMLSEIISKNQNSKSIIHLLYSE